MPASDSNLPTRHGRRAVTVLALLAATAIAAHAADGRYPIYQPTTITQPGSYYVTRDIIGPVGAPVITVSSSNVTLDLNGHTLQPQGANSTGISGGEHSNVRITNGKVMGGDRGVFFPLVQGGDIQVDHLELYAQTSSGIAYGIFIGSNSGAFPPTRVRISENRIVTPFGQLDGHAIFVQNVHGGVIEKNDIIRPSSFGIYVSSCRGVTISENTITEATSRGIYLEVSTVCTVWRNNVKSGNTGNGIELLNSDTNALDGNASMGNPQFGIRFDSNSTGNVYSNNRLMGNGSGNDFGASNVSAGGNNAGSANF